MNKMQIRKQWATLPLATDKRHLVFGDIHGRFATFINLLDAINYDPAGDVLYSVGDLIDRGPDSVSAIEFFKQDNCHAIRGNHEQMLVNLAEWRDVWLYRPNGGPATLMSLEQHGRDVEWLQSYCTDTPIILDVGANDDDNAFRLVHAENPFMWSEQMLIENIRNMSPMERGESRLLWGRTNITTLLNNVSYMLPPTTNVLVNPERSKRNTFCGHTPTTDVMRGYNTSWIDTYEGGKMTCVDAITNEVYSVLMVPGE